MNKMIKGSVAGATGIVLLMGGFGTYALWSDSADLKDSTVQSGRLDISTVGAPVWTDESPDRTSANWSANDRMVPGDVVKMTQSLDIDAVGKNLELDLAVTPVNAADDNGADWDSLQVAMELDDKDLATAGNGHFTATAAAAALHTLEVTFTFPHGTPGSADERRTLDLSDLGVTVTQARPTPAP
jgi:alternate signal-mediated exported protein